MGRVLVILAAACLLAILAILYYSPMRLIDGGSTPVEAAGGTKPEAEEPTKKTETPRSRNVRTAQGKSLPASDVAQPRGKIVAYEVFPVGPSSHATIRRDSTPLYTTNSTESDVLGLLKKGDKVGSDLQIIDTEGKWSIVRKTDENVSGFVREENLQRERSTEQTTIWRSSAAAQKRKPR